MPTKAELEHQLRRAERALSQALLDLRELPSTSAEHITPPARPMVMEALERAEQEWERVVVDPCNRVNSYIQSRDGIGWTWEEPYVRNGQFAWGGAFAACIGFSHSKKYSSPRRECAWVRFLSPSKQQPTCAASILHCDLSLSLQW